MEGTPASQEMPRYRCHKEVSALKIREAIQMMTTVEDENGAHSERDGGLLEFFNYEPIRVSQDWMDNHEPEEGGYYVVYEDGYVSFSPAKAFEEGYTRL